MNEKKNLNLIIVVSSPSGAGKTTICKELVNKDNKLSISVSDTTRLPRDNEIDGKDYHFISEQEFQLKIQNKEYIEYANVFGNYYGSSIENINKLLDRGKDVLFDIDWQGAKQLKEQNYDNLLTIFVMPPSKDTVHERLKSRALNSGDSLLSINKRLSTYEEEVSHKDEYDYIVLNENFQRCIEEIQKLINNARELLFTS